MDFKRFLMKINLKAFWREILIAILIGLLIWVSGSQRIVTVGSSDTVCIIDTIVQKVPAVVVRYQRVLLTRTDTINVSDTIQSIRLDTSWLYADVPVQIYKDTNYYIRTIGWLDSLHIHHSAHPVESPVLDIPRRMSIHATLQAGHGVTAPGIQLSVRRWLVGYQQNIVNGTGQLTVGYKLY